MCVVAAGIDSSIGPKQGESKGKRENKKPQDKFEWSYTDEPHFTRRKLIQKAHPEITELFGPDPNTKYVVLLAVATQIAAAYVAQNIQSGWAFFFFTYSLGGCINHSMTLAMHEISHNLAFKSFVWNKILGITANLPLGIPAFGSFRMYHAEHHKFQVLQTICIFYFLVFSALCCLVSFTSSVLLMIFP
jgi:hypothetical protein